MQTGYNDPNHMPTSNTTASTAVETSSDGVDLSPVKSVPDFKKRTTDWAITIPDEDMNLPLASSACNKIEKSLHGNDDRVLLKTVHGNDDRVRIKNTTVFPYKCIARLYITGQNGDRWSGSGFFIGPKCVITSGHVVFPDRRWASEIKVVPGQNGNNGPFGAQVSRKFCSVAGWTDDNRENPEDYDYGAIILPDTTLYNRICAYFEYQVNDNPGTLNNSGYPVDKSVDKWKGTQWFNAGPVLRTSTRRFFYKIDTSEGQSGSPVWVNSGSNLIVVGVHGYGIYEGEDSNSAIRCIEDVARNWTDWRNK